ncbi:MAG: two-component regulator propeller domain-containing protein [Flavobacteriales bacterium]
MQHRPLYIYVILTLVFAATAMRNAAQTYVGQTYQRKDGLISQNVNCVAQDKQGYLWFGTDEGVSRFDGKRFQNFTTDDGLCDNEVLGIAADSAGHIWFLSVSGCIAFFYEDKFFNASNTASLKVYWNTLGAVHFAEDSMGNICISGFSDQVLVITPELKVHALQVSHHSFDHPVFTFTQDDRIQVVQGTDVLTLMLDEYGKTFSHASHYYMGELFHGELVGDGFLFIAPQGIVRTEGVGLSTIVSADSLPVDFTKGKIHSGENASFWLTTQQEGCLYWQYTDSGYVKSEPTYNRGWITDVLCDRDGNHWYCTRGDGVRRVTPTPHIFLNRLGNNEAGLCLVKDLDGHVWAGTNKGMVYQFVDDYLAMVLQMTNRLSDKSVKNFVFDQSGNLWCASLEGIYRFSNTMGFWNPAPINITSINDLRNICLSPSNEVLFSDMSIVGLLSIAPNGTTQIDTLLKPAQRVYHPFVDSKGRFYFDQGDGLYWIKNGNAEHVLANHAGFGSKISNITETDDGYLVVSTYGSGILFLKDGQLVRSLDKSNGLSTNQCKAVYVEANWHYAATNEGLFVYQFSNGGADVAYSITTAHGLPTNNINDVVVTANKFYLATTEGVIMVDRNIGSSMALPPPLHWSSFITADKQVPIANLDQVKFTNSLTRIAFNAISFDRPNELRYEYKLHSADSLWIQAESNVLEFLALPAGDYNLMVRARKFNSDWSQPIVLPFHVLPPYYATAWFRVLAFMVLSSIVLFIYRFYTNRSYERKLAVLQREQAVLSERNRIALEMHDDLGSELSNIVILTKIAGTKLGLSGEQTRPIAEIDRAATNTSRKMNEIIWALNPANDKLENLVAYLQRFANDFLELHDMGGNVDVPSALPDVEVQAQRRRNIFLVVKEAFHNIHKHANANSADLHIAWHEHTLRIEIKDNGRGFTETELKRVGNGLKSMRKRALDAGGVLEINSNAGQGAQLNLVVQF